MKHFIKVTYDLREFCSTCGVGKTQVAPFRMKGEPKWGKKHIFQLNWVFDEFFVLTSAWEETFRPLGIGCTPVLDHRTGNELLAVVQLEIKDKAHQLLALNDKYPSEICPTCRRKKYLPIVRGFFPDFIGHPAYQLCRTQEYFGSGASAWNAIFVNSELYRVIQDHKLSGVTFVPVEKQKT